MKKGVDYTGVTVVFLCHDGEGNVLLNKRSENCRDEHGRWDPGGGGVEFGTPIEETLRNEIMEEYCTDVLDVKFVGFRDMHRTHEGKRTHWIALDFFVKVDRSKVKNGEPHKFDDLGWFTLDSLPEPMHSQWPEFLENYKKMLTSDAPASSGS